MSCVSKQQIYGNYKVYSPDDKLMFRCDKKKLDWYLKKNLAQKIDEDSIRLNFVPAGAGFISEAYFLQNRENKCVVCGKTEDLSKHHVVPYCYRKFFPIHIKRHNYYDVLPLCMKCHDYYEVAFSKQKRKDLEKQYDAPINGSGLLDDAEQDQACRYANALMQYGKKIPADKRQKMYDTLVKYYGYHPSETEMQEMSLRSMGRYYKGPYYKTHAELVVSRLENLEAFIQDWRQHFVDTMNPQFLPEGWSVNSFLIPGEKKS